MIVDTFAGPGGWDEGLRLLGRTDVVGLEWDDAACDTAEAAGHVRHRVDVAQADPADYQGAEGFISSPPCQAFSLAGKQAGRAAIDRMLAHVVACLDGWTDPPASICTDDLRADLTLQPLRWVDALRPAWVALEQVPPVLPLWRAIGEVFEAWGYSVQVAKLNAANYGVPQTRQRAVLVASRTRPAVLPEGTHYDPRKGGGLFGEPWVSMAEALGWGRGLRPSPTVTGEAGSQWVFERPATTVVGSFRPDVIAAPGWRTSEDGSRQDAPGSVRVTVEQAAVLQSFRPDYPWQGSKTKQYQQVGNAVPPLLAAAVLRQFVDAKEAAA